MVKWFQTLAAILAVAVTAHLASESSPALLQAQKRAEQVREQFHSCQKRSEQKNLLTSEPAFLIALKQYPDLCLECLLRWYRKAWKDSLHTGIRRCRR
jgi:hypothetical protein